MQAAGVRCARPSAREAEPGCSACAPVGRQGRGGGRVWRPPPFPAAPRARRVGIVAEPAERARDAAGAGRGSRPRPAPSWRTHPLGRAH